MSYYRWDFAKLPESEYKSVIEFTKNQDIIALAMIHNKYKLSNNEYCCAKDYIIKFYEQAIEKGYIK